MVAGLIRVMWHRKSEWLVDHQEGLFSCLLTRTCVPVFPTSTGFDELDLELSRLDLGLLVSVMEQVLDKKTMTNAITLFRQFSIYNFGISTGKVPTCCLHWRWPTPARIFGPKALSGLGIPLDPFPYFHRLLKMAFSRWIVGYIIRFGDRKDSCLLLLVLALWMISVGILVRQKSLSSCPS